MDEAAALLSTLAHTPADAPTACAGWTAHELVAHLAAGAAEIADLTEAVVAGRPARATRAFAQREAPYVALADDVLRDRLVVEALRLDDAVAALPPSAVVPFSGRELTASELTMHGRSEAALHRWDLAGDDAISRELLAAPELTAHAVGVLNGMPDRADESVAARATAAGTHRGRYAFASPGQPDVVLMVDGETTRLELDDAPGVPTASANAVTRLLALWGRRAAGVAVAWSDDSGANAQLSGFLWTANYKVGFPPD